MRTGHYFSALAIVAWAVLVTPGCDDAGYDEFSKAPLNKAQDHEHDHDHGAHEGKHGGHVIELDDTHSVHAELLFDSATRDITLYFYGSEIGVAKAASELVFEIEQDGKELVLESKAVPLDGETAEACSRFTVAGAGLPEAIKSEEQLDAHFHVTIDGKEFVGELHAHSHDEHAHGEAEHKADEHATGDAEHKAEGATESKGDEKSAADAPKP